MANKKPVFNQFAESRFDNSGGQSYNDVTNYGTPIRFKKTGQTKSDQTEESKWIKRTNEQLKGIYGFVDQEDNKYIAAWERVFENAGLIEDVDFVRKTKDGVDIPYLRNTKAMRDKVDNIRKVIYDEGARTLKSIRDQAISDLKAEGKKATKSNIDDKLNEYRAFATLDSNADYIYWREEKGDTSLSKYTDMLRGLSADSTRFRRVVTDMADAVKKAKAAERKQNTKYLRRVNIDGVK